MTQSMRFCLLFVTMTAACGSALPDEVSDYKTRCTRLNAQPIARSDADPHKGVKNVYACNISVALLQDNQRPFPEGTMIVKESTREGDSFAWLIATAQKQKGTWQWNEYTRNFADEDFRHIISGESVCTGCHIKAKAADWIFTGYSR